MSKQSFHESGNQRRVVLVKAEHGGWTVFLDSMWKQKEKGPLHCAFTAIICGGFHLRVAGLIVSYRCPDWLESLLLFFNLDSCPSHLSCKVRDKALASRIGILWVSPAVYFCLTPSFLVEGPDFCGHRGLVALSLLSRLAVSPDTTSRPLRMRESVAQHHRYLAIHAWF